MRRRYFVTYDISDDKRRAKVFKALEREGDHVQYSVFTCDLNQQELVRLTAELREIIHHREDQVLLLDLGNADRLPDSFISAVGRAYQTPCPPIVV